MCIDVGCDMQIIGDWRALRLFSGGPGYINTDAFCALPTGGIYGNGTGWGNSGRGVIRGPGQFNWDISIIKDTMIREGHRFQFRTEFYNLMNTPQFDELNHNIAAQLFSAILNTVNKGRVVQMMLKLQF